MKMPMNSDLNSAISVDSIRSEDYIDSLIPNTSILQISELNNSWLTRWKKV